ncbi:MAG: hypothetical protein PWQ10_139 [Patescibacteria group bacterium]|nr:hypothetical protein [Patescibacteria group bacterium]
MEKAKTSNEAEQAKDYLMILGRIADELSKVERVPRYTNGERENDVEHSYLLALSATEIAKDYFPELDSGLVTQFCLVHDLTEVYAGDTSTLNISDENLVKKQLSEQEAFEKLSKELPPYTLELLIRYEAQIEPEARFVRYIDKIMPGIINIVGKDVSTFLEDGNINGLEKFDKVIKDNQQRLQNMFPELPFITELMFIVEYELRKTFFKVD